MKVSDRLVAEKLIPAKVFAEIPAVSEKFHINTPLRMAHFLAQCAHESLKFSVPVENLNYSAEGLKKTFPKYFPGDTALAYARKPEKIASRVYGGRLGNGDESTMDGWKYRGRGFIQLTGKDNYRQFDSFVEEDILSNPDLISTKYPLLSAAWFFHKNGILQTADQGDTDAVIASVTKRVNGGTIGLADRIKYFRLFYPILLST